MEFDKMQDNLEDSGESACISIAALNSVKKEEAEQCDNTDKSCPYCLWRDPAITPAVGDQFVLPNGKTIEVFSINRSHVVTPKLEYEFPAWKKWDGGRKRYEIDLIKWPTVIKDATLIRIGPLPSTFDKNFHDKAQAFRDANYKLGQTEGLSALLRREQLFAVKQSRSEATNEH